MNPTIFTARFREAFQLRGYTQSELSELSGVTQVQISKYLNGKVLPKLESLKALARALNVSENWLAGENVPMIQQIETLPAEEKLKVALFGGDEAVTDEEWAEVQNFVAYIKSKRGTKN